MSQRFATFIEVEIDGVLTQVVDNLIRADHWPEGIDVTDHEPPVRIGDHYIDGVFVTPAPAEEPAVETRRWISVKAFLLRIEDEERQHLKIVAVINPTAPTEEQKISAMVDDFYDLVKSSKYIDLDDPKLIEGFGALEFVGILDVGRGDQIRFAPILEHELP